MGLLVIPLFVIAELRYTGQNQCHYKTVCTLIILSNCLCIILWAGNVGKQWKNAQEIVDFSTKYRIAYEMSYKVSAPVDDAGALDAFAGLKLVWIFRLMAVATGVSPALARRFVIGGLISGFNQIYLCLEWCCSGAWSALKFWRNIVNHSKICDTFRFKRIGRIFPFN